MALDIIIPKGEKQAIEHIVDGGQVRLHVEEDAKAVVYLTLTGDAEMQVAVHQNATLTLVCIQAEACSITQRSKLATGASLQVQNVSLAPGEHTLESRIEGDHARSDIDWIFYTKGDEQQKIFAENIFEGQSGEGEITLRGIAQDKAHVTCNGLINIGLGGKGTNTYLTEDVLMLDNTAKVDAIPGLEIKTNDVKASHSATVSKVTLEDLFYFASRGIDEHTSRHMYIVGFLAGLAGRITDETMRERIHTLIEEKYAL